MTVEIERFQSNERGYDINGLILVEREGQKKMVIGTKPPRSLSESKPVKT
ncbi:MAG: KH domain-containing protein [Enterobacter hormaechei]